MVHYEYKFFQWLIFYYLYILRDTYNSKCLKSKGGGGGAAMRKKENLSFTIDPNLKCCLVFRSSNLLIVLSSMQMFLLFQSVQFCLFFWSMYTNLFKIRIQMFLLYQILMFFHISAFMCLLIIVTFS